MVFGGSRTKSGRPSSVEPSSARASSPGAHAEKAQGKGGALSQKVLDLSMVIGGRRGGFQVGLHP